MGTVAVIVGAEILIEAANVRGVVFLCTPVFAGLIAGRRGPRRGLQGAAACALAALLLLGGGNLVHGAPQAGRDLVPSLCLLGYFTLAGGGVAQLAAIADKRPEL